jgi:DNA-directed RNA polymerase III subunit RPC1
MNFFIKTFR